VQRLKLQKNGDVVDGITDYNEPTVAQIIDMEEWAKTELHVEKARFVVGCSDGHHIQKLWFLS
jgi:hypothetical protein